MRQQIPFISHGTDCMHDAVHPTDFLFRQLTQTTAALIHPTWSILALLSDLTTNLTFPPLNKRALTLVLAVNTLPPVSLSMPFSIHRLELDLKRSRYSQRNSHR